MHVVHLGKYYPPHRGGIERVVEGLCRGLVVRGQQVTVVASNDSAETLEETLAGVRVIRLARTALVQSQPINFELGRCLRALDYDVLHVHTPNPMGALAALRARRRDRALLVSHHSDIVRQRLLGTVGYVAHRALYARADSIVVATPLHVRYSPLLQRFEAKTQIIPYFVGPPPAWNATSAAAALPSSWLGQPFALFVGRLVYYKGVEVLIAALSRCERLRLVIVGEGPLLARLQKQVGAANLDQRVLFLGNVEENMLQTLYASCRFLVLPSIAVSEAFGMVQLEAMAAGRPVISTNLRSGVPYVNQHGRTGLLVPPSDVGALANAMQKLLEDEALCTRLGQAGKVRAGEQFSEARVLEQWLELYARL